jgi:hypothetical protein
MQRLGILSEEILRIMQGETPQDARYDLARAFLERGHLPNGERWRDGAPRFNVQIGDADATKVQRIKREAVGEARDRTVRFDVRFRVAPSRAGGAGIGIDGSAVETFMSRALDAPCDDQVALFQLALAMRTVAEARLEDLRVAVDTTFRRDALWRIVGWAQRNLWQVQSVDVTRVALEAPVVDRNRGESWLAKRWEVWIPFTMDVVATLQRRA